MVYDFSSANWGSPYAEVCYDLKMTEEWKPAPGYEGFYEVSSLGHARSVERTITRSNGRVATYRSCEMKTTLRSGYPSFVACIAGEKHSVTIHRLVCEAFNGPAPAGKPLALHRNGDREDNRSENLYWGDHQENQKDAVRHGTHPGANLTHCKRGHEFTEENTRLRNGTRRVCRTCHRDRERTASRRNRGV